MNSKKVRQAQSERKLWSAFQALSDMTNGYPEDWTPEQLQALKAARAALQQVLFPSVTIS